MKYPTVDKYNKMLDAIDGAKSDERDMSELIKLFDQFATANPRIRGHILSRRAAITSWDFQIVAFDKSDDEKAAEVERRLKSALGMIIKRSIYKAIYGMFAVALEWRNSPGIGFVPVVTPVSNSILLPASNTTVYQRIENKISEIGLDNRFIAGSDDGLPGGQMRSVGIFEIFRSDMMIEWANYNRKLKGIIQGVEHGASDQERAAAVQALQSAVSNNYILTSDLIEFFFHSITQGGAGESFKSMLEHIDDTIAIAMLGQANTVDMPKKYGSRAGLEVQERISADIMWEDLNNALLAGNQLIEHDYNLSYRGQTQVPWGLKFITNEGDDAERNVTIISDALAAGIDLKRTEVYEKIGFTPPAVEDDVIQGAGS